MSHVVNRYGNTSLAYKLFMRSVPRTVVAVTAGAAALEFVGSGFVDFLWDSLNKGKQWPEVRAQILKRQAKENPLDAITPADVLKRAVQ